MSVKKIGPVSFMKIPNIDKEVRFKAREEFFFVCDEKLTMEEVKDITQTKPIRVARRGKSIFGLYRQGPLILSEFYYLYRNNLYRLDREYSENEVPLLIMDYEDKERRKFERLKKKFELAQEIEKQPRRESIPEEVRIAVWRRDGGKCARCGSREKLEYDHIIPVSKGGSNTVRNIELLCESCNRKKKNNIS